MERSDGILVRLTKLTDTSWIVHWFTEEAGLIKTVAKGARRPKSPFAGKLDLFFSSEVHWSRARRGELHTLREAEPHHLREGIRRDYHSALVAGYFCRLLETAVELEHPEPSLHDLLRRGLDHIDTSGASSRALLHFETELARLLGLGQEKRQAAPALREALGGLPALRDQALEALADSSKKPFADRSDKS